MRSSRRYEEPARRQFPDELLTPREVAEIFAVNPKTVVRWANTGKLRFTRTPGGRRRYSRREIESLIREGDPQ